MDLDRFPIRRAAALWSKIAGGVGGVLAALVTAGWVTAGQGDAIGSAFTALDGLGVAVSAVVTAGTAVWASFQTAKDGERDATPLSDPRDRSGAPLRVEHQ
ncbi:MAG: hypothetical protein GEU83_08550 [Pseudonocardiaceae bacterium]|nr:hypothetical protein [Pseudonocardiaceae bacterium]